MRRYRLWTGIATMSLLLVSCAPIGKPVDNPSPPAAQRDSSPVEQTIPVVPLERVLQMPGTVKIYPARTALYTHDTRYPIVGYTAGGEVEHRKVDAVIFPTDLLIVLATEGAEPVAFLQRSPHGGCPIQWDDVDGYFVEGCYGSRWTVDGEYIFGPALQDLDQLPVELREGMVWITNRIIRGAHRTL